MEACAICYSRLSYNVRAEHYAYCSNCHEYRDGRLVTIISDRELLEV